MDGQVTTQAHWKIDSCIVRLIPKNDLSFNAEQLRGFFGYFFIDDEGFHHHGNSKAYSYPLVQYKVIKATPVLLGLGDYAAIVQKRASEIERATLPAGELEFARTEISRSTTAIKSSQECYGFLTPWVALNQENYRQFKKMTMDARKKELERILTGNILSFLKAFGIRIDFRLQTSILQYEPTRTTVHGNDFEGFKAVFKTNIILPPFVGLGKSVSKGFGTILPQAFINTNSTGGLAEKRT